AFRAALPNLSESIREQLDVAKAKYEAALLKLQQQDPTVVRSHYNKYITEFRATIRSYVAYRAEIDAFFPIELAGKKYRDIAARYDKWNRKQSITWRAYQTIDQLQTAKNGILTSLDLKLIGGRHFHRLQQVFAYMVLSFKPREPSRDWIDTAAAFLYGGNSDYENMEKAVREIMRTLIRETFLMGICWLTQMYSLLTEMFAKEIKRYLLSERFSHLRDHVKFLSAVDLEYHNTVRNFIRQANESIKHARDSGSAYVVHDITARLKYLVFSIPAEIPHRAFDQKVPGLAVKVNNEYVEATIADVFKHIPPQKLMNLINGSGSFLTVENRDVETFEHHSNGRKAIIEIYTAVAGQLLNAITTSFNSNVVMKIQEYDTMSIERALNDRINRMSDEEIGEMANIQIAVIKKNLSDAEREINDLYKASHLIEVSIQEMENGRVLDSDERQKLTQKLERARDGNKLYSKVKEGELRRKLKRDKTKRRVHDQSHTDDDEENEFTDNIELLDNERELMLCTDKTTADAFLLALYQKHDMEDLISGFLPGDSLEADKENPRCQIHLNVDENRLDFDNVKIASLQKTASRGLQQRSTTTEVRDNRMNNYPSNNRSATTTHEVEQNENIKTKQKDWSQATDSDDGEKYDILTTSDIGDYNLNQQQKQSRQRRTHLKKPFQKKK
ncbi:unnamed protein product, partial [Didymodactylos carnosus]